MNPEARQYQAKVGNTTMLIETGRLAGQAGGAVTVRVGDALVFAAATMSVEVRTGIDFFPLTVDYEERMYAGGRIPGSFFRREGRPSEDAILTARLTDRPLRPLFPKDMRNDVQLIMYSFSADGENPLDILAINAASAAVSISDIPWAGPIGAVRVGRVDGEFVINPTFAQIAVSDLDLRIAGTRDAILMVECGANQVTEADMLAALEFGHAGLQPIITMIEQMRTEVGKPKREYKSFAVDADLQARVNARLEPVLRELLPQADKAARKLAVEELALTTVAEFASEDPSLEPDVRDAFEQSYKTVVRSRITKEGVRLDGRGLDDIRPIWCDIDVSPRAHGSGLFTRGETQVLTLATLGTPGDAQELDTLTPIETKRYMHHYNFPPFSTGEAKMLRGSSRRDVGHGALAERALLPVIPPVSDFPYTLRLVSEVLSSNGSSSMASVCGSTLALMDTGVPILAPVAGVAMGLIKEGENYTILTDILGAEDHLGDMDFKVAGTAQGITALQMDIKIKGLTPEIMRIALDKAHTARLKILDTMLATLPAPRPDLKSFVPRITMIRIPVEKIGAVIGPGGKMIRSIQEETGVKIDIEDDGSVFIAASDGEAARVARERIESLTETAVVGRIYTGKVVRIADFGAFVEILPNMDGMVHISQLDSTRVNKVEDVVRMGDEITVMVTDIDSNGKIRLSRQAVLEGWTPEEALEHDRPRSGGKPQGGRPSGGRPQSGRGDYRRGSGGNRS
jgi:polyribonucleotide nucleotidyltransferase